ncbi:hypothetical protein PHSY_007377 [Pseudozyma hubeiensis SY62]|uniref:GATA-type domain-containing protein n=1 Tax=Pseudozyma hubeiensis (strain SY62) TaxID=1305764 RepID=R9PEJ1_PSEHS|nr:hypothetical protein PHSY_007377 [Pseudozyma hubeiensis SY62]GAC99774.1 hypothetical protein PHSY_007377 [Pseudozyma hubeiensis SY62]
MSACDYISTVPESPCVSKRTPRTLHPSESYPVDPRSDRSVRDPRIFSPSTSTLRGTSASQQFSNHIPSDDKAPLRPTRNVQPQHTSEDAIASMDHRPKQAKVTLPPLSALTTSIDFERNRAHSLIHDRGHNLSPIFASRDMVDRDVGRRSSVNDTREAPAHNDGSRSTDRSIPREPHRASAAGSLSLPSSFMASTSHQNPTDDPPTPRLAEASVRVITEATRPRSHSSPHKNRMQNLSRRSSLADASQVDRLLDSLLYVQDINRRLGLDVSNPASPSIFRNADAAERLRNKLLDELDSMSLFSRSRAESVASYVGVAGYMAPYREASTRNAVQESPIRTIAPLAAVAAAGQAGYAAWPPADSLERTHSSIDRLTLDDQVPRVSDHHSRPSAYGSERVGAPSGPQAMSRNGFAPQPTHSDRSHRPISRAISFEQLRALPDQQHHAHLHERAPAGSSRYGDAPLFAHEHTSHHPYSQVGPRAPPMHFADAQHQHQMDIFDRRRLASKGMKRVRKRKNEHHQECLGCQAKETPEWRKGPMGPRTLCNACGLLYAKLTKRKQQEAEAAARASGKTAQEIVREREESPGAKQASLEALRAELNLANGLRNRPSSASASTGDTLLHNESPSAAAYHAGRVYDGRHPDGPSNQPWPSRRAEDFEMLAHPTHGHRSTITSPGRSNSLGHVHNLEQSTAKQFERISESSAGYALPTPPRPISREDNSASRSLAQQPGRRRSSTLQSSRAAPSRYNPASYHDRPISPSTPSSQSYAQHGSSVQRRPHPYM